MVLRGVKFSDIHTGNDWGLILNDKTLNPPEVKTVYVAVDGKDGSLDLSESLAGEIRYDNRTLKFTLLLTDGSYIERENLITEINAYIHGKKHKIILDDDLDHYMLGRCSVTNVSNDNAYGSITIECNCEPWRYAVNETIRITTVTEGAKVEVAYPNLGGKTVNPEITVEGDITLTIGDSRTALSDGTYKLTNFLLKTGTTVITVEGSGTLTVKYREGVL